jgi:hypothetical protein
MELDISIADENLIKKNKKKYKGKKLMPRIEPTLI